MLLALALALTVTLAPALTVTLTLIPTLTPTPTPTPTPTLSLRLTLAQVPRVLLVVQGGPGTLASILAAIEGESPVVLVRDSGGVATLLDHFLNTYKVRM